METDLITATVFYSYQICPREAWLYYHRINSDRDHEYLVLGRLVHESSYKRYRKELIVDNVLKIDFFRNELVAEVKKSSRHKKAAKLQLAYCLYHLKHKKGLELQGVLLFPKERKTEVVVLTPELESEVEEILNRLRVLVRQRKPPPAVKIKYCKSCAFQELCWA